MLLSRPVIDEIVLTPGHVTNHQRQPEGGLSPFERQERLPLETTEVDNAV